ncbi:conjugative transposon protein TraK [Mucilaginibacter sp. L3T2-6]|uniref:conjugative transposon protein TraK n=1 Tax=Mucilaginibacter sp. L3T2-6 TaxID=3062491 RepID=UPI002675A00E|nr:conjugative transposon protein TraK [Mucilaginibacter sp. L3T2-6]MDO3641234.1 conjugative transposon protein TraK [Mucilaginibacter sp. L3T2-6]MDV6214007.1 conjugative transposon protein TraK [Mucilaginibacter sp. L3T2-6]
MFKKMKNIETAFQHVRSFTIAVVIAAAVISCYTVYQCKTLIAAVQSRIYILYNGKVLEALEADRKDNVAVEARDHVKTFHELFFTLDPDDKVIRANLTKALYLADESAKREYDNLSENGYYANVIAGNISQQIKVDSVSVDLRNYPYAFRCYATQSIIRTTSTVTRSLVTQGELRNVSRSDNNPHGFLIQRWETLENRDIKVINH